MSEMQRSLSPCDACDVIRSSLDFSCPVTSNSPLETKNETRLFGGKGILNEPVDFKSGLGFEETMSEFGEFIAQGNSEKSRGFEERQIIDLARLGALDIPLSYLSPIKLFASCASRSLSTSIVEKPAMPKLLSTLN